MMNDAAVNFIKCQLVFGGFILLVAYILSLSGFNINAVTILYVIAFYMAIVPFFLTKSLLNPICIYSVILIIQLLDFGLQNALGMELRYYPSLVSGEVELLRIRSLVIIVLWAFFLGVGYFIGSKSLPHSEVMNKDKLNGVRSRRKAIKLFSVLCVILSIYSLFAGLSVAGGFTGMLSAMSDRSDAYQGYGYLRTFAQFGVFGAMGLLYLDRKYSSLLVLALSFFSTAMFGGRAAAILGVFLPYVFYWNWCYSRISTKSILIYGVAGVAFIFFMEIFKYQNREFMLDINKLLFSMSRGMADILPSMLHAIDVGTLEYQYGKSLLNVFLILIPRALWPSKPEGLGEDALLGRALIGEDYWGIPPGPYGVAYLNFSYFGVALFALMSGLLSKYLFRKFCSLKNDAKYFWFCVSYTFVFLKVFNFPSVYSVMQFFVAFIFSYLLLKSCAVICRLRISL